MFINQNIRELIPCSFNLIGINGESLWMNGIISQYKEDKKID